MNYQGLKSDKRINNEIKINEWMDMDTIGCSSNNAHLLIIHGRDKSFIRHRKDSNVTKLDLYEAPDFDRI